jgi:hypothetical protein
MLLWVSPVDATTYFVATTGSDAANGTSSGTAWRTIQKAADTVNPGDLVNVAAGTYQERVVFGRAGSAGSLITFLCTTNRACIVDGGTSASGWTQAGGFPNGVFEIANSAYGFSGNVPAHATIGDQMIVFVRPGITSQVDYLAQAPGSVEWQGVEGACKNFGTFTRCRFQDDADPDTKPLKLAPENIGAFMVSGATKGYLTFDGFYFKNAYSCLIVGEEAHHVTLQNSTCTNGYYAVWVRFGAHDNLFQNNRWFVNWIYEDHGHHRYTLVNQANVTQENVFQAMRDAMPITSSFYLIDPGSNNKVLNNVFDHTGAAGIYLWSTNYLGDPSYTYANTEIGYNSFNNCQDYCFQIQDTKAINFQFHDNSINTYYNATRIGRVLNASGENFYYYRNTATNPDGCAACARGGDLEFSAVNSVAAGIFPNGGKGYFYHNTSNGRDSGILAYSNQNMQNIFFVNNIMSPGKNWVMELAGDPAFGSRLWIGGAMGSGNGAGNTTTAPSWTTAPMMWRTNIRIWSDAQTDFTPAAGYETIDAGLNLSTTWGPSQPALPGMSPGYFAGTAPDLGAIEFGAVIAPPLGVPKLSGKIVLSGRIQLE